MKKFLVLLTMLGLSFSFGNVFAQENGLSQKVSHGGDYQERQEGKIKTFQSEVNVAAKVMQW